MGIQDLGGSLLDTALDRAVIPGYTSVGFRLRQAGWTENPTPGALRGRTAMVTGAGSGIGTAITAALAELGATVLMVVRDRERGERTREELAAQNPDADLHVAVCDVADLGAVRELAAELTGRLAVLDVVVHNAGLLPAARSETADGHELTLATHVLGPLLLTECLAPVLAKSDDARVILMSSGGMYTQALPVDDPEYRTGPYRGAIAYARTKRMQVAFTPVLADRWAPQGISVYCMHPGWADTPGVAESLPIFRMVTRLLLRSPAQGADTAVWLAATTPAPPTGLFWHDRRPRPQHYLPVTRDDDHDLQVLWRYCVRAIGVDDD